MNIVKSLFEIICSLIYAVQLAGKPAESWTSNNYTHYCVTFKALRGRSFQCIVHLLKPYNPAVRIVHSASSLQAKFNFEGYGGGIYLRCRLSLCRTFFHKIFKTRLLQTFLKVNWKRGLNFKQAFFLSWSFVIFYSRYLFIDLISCKCLGTIGKWRYETFV